MSPIYCQWFWPFNKLVYVFWCVWFVFSPLCEATMSPQKHKTWKWGHLKGPLPDLIRKRVIYKVKLQLWLVRVQIRIKDCHQLVVRLRVRLYIIMSSDLFMCMLLIWHIRQDDGDFNEDLRTLTILFVSLCPCRLLAQHWQLTVHPWVTLWGRKMSWHWSLMVRHWNMHCPSSSARLSLTWRCPARLSSAAGREKSFITHIYMHKQTLGLLQSICTGLEFWMHKAQKYSKLVIYIVSALFVLRFQLTISFSRTENGGKIYCKSKLVCVATNGIIMFSSMNSLLLKHGMENTWWP